EIGMEIGDAIDDRHGALLGVGFALDASRGHGGRSTERLGAFRPAAKKRRRRSERRRRQGGSAVKSRATPMPDRSAVGAAPLRRAADQRADWLTPIGDNPGQ